MMNDSSEALRLAMEEDQMTDTLRLRLARTFEIKLIGGTVGRTTVYRVNSDELVAKILFANQTAPRTDGLRVPVDSRSSHCAAARFGHSSLRRARDSIELFARDACQ